LPGDRDEPCRYPLPILIVMPTIALTMILWMSDWYWIYGNREMSDPPR
jgi:hypothetical protein